MPANTSRSLSSWPYARQRYRPTTGTGRNVRLLELLHHLEPVEPGYEEVE